MPIHLYWGDDTSALERAVQEIIDAVVEADWKSVNLSRLDGNRTEQATQALNEARSEPFGSGGRVVLLQYSPFCERCPAELAKLLDDAITLVPEKTHLLLVSRTKPDARLKTTKALRKTAREKSFQLPAFWDSDGQVELVRRTAKELGLQLIPQAAEMLADNVGNDSIRLENELEKLGLYCGQRPIREAAVEALTGPAQQNALLIGKALLAGEVASAVKQIDDLLANNEPPLRLISSLTSQVRGWLWVSLLTKQGEQDVGVIARAAGIGNPKRIYVMRKQLAGRKPQSLLQLLQRLLSIEAALKLGTKAEVAFRDGFIG